MKRKPKPALVRVLATAARLPKVRIGKHITGGELTMRFMCPVDAGQEKAIAAMLERHTKEIISEASKITGKDVRYV